MLRSPESKANVISAESSRLLRGRTNQGVLSGNLGRRARWDCTYARRQTTFHCFLPKGAGCATPPKLRTEIPRVPTGKDHVAMLVKAKEKKEQGISTDERIRVSAWGLAQKMHNGSETVAVVGWRVSLRRENFQFSLIWISLLLFTPHR